MNVLEHLRQTVTEILRADPRRVVLGEDVRDGGMLGLTREAAAHEDLSPRLLGLPLAPASLPALAAGLAMSGARPLVLLPSAAAVVDGLAALREAALLGWRTGGNVACELTFVAPFGPGFGTGEDAVEAVDALAATVPGLRVLCLGEAAEAPALLRAATEPSTDPAVTLVLLPRALLLQDVADEDLVDELAEPLGAARVRRTGSEACVYAWGASVGLATAAVAETGRDVSVIDVASLAPLDRETLVAHSTSGKIIIAHGGPREHGLGSSLAALFADASLLYLDAPIVRVTGADAPLPPAAEHRGLPSTGAIARAIEAAINY